MQIRKVRIVTNGEGYGPGPPLDVEIEQRLTISSSGMIWFTAYEYKYDKESGEIKFEICRRKQFSIGRDRASEILELFSRYLQSGQPPPFATDCGMWEMTITDTGGKSYRKTGSVCGGVKVGDIDLTDYVREAIPIDRMFVFEGYFETEED